MARTRTHIVLELKKARDELRRAEDAGSAIEAIDKLNHLLDERLEQRGVHPADCSCWECARAVADVMAHRLGECTDPRDVAGESGW